MNIIDKLSPNFYTGRRGYAPEAIVVHIMEGTLSGTDAWFANTNSKVSAHYGVGLDGSIHRYVKETDTAWHAGRVSAPTWKLIKSSGPYFINPNFYTVGIEHEGSATTPWSDEMYKASADLIADLAKRWKIPLDRNHVLGHHEIYSLKTCPGLKVDINRLISIAGGTPLVVPPPYQTVMINGQTTTFAPLNIRLSPNRTLAPVTQVKAGKVLTYVGYTPDGESVNGNKKWYLNASGQWFWSGGTR